ncbi:Temptin [Gracilariopsis chorda]|uniref:Temptin n=1 Tax=Gracilariopsis chorda TaxID=448386 RepID=A0A2V3J2J0_9FLOR|nr:Temptin [Gracilariopsis chorda]|eukprot:PXF48661.1 Temptin [Gracilariopsis chorda]
MNFVVAVLVALIALCDARRQYLQRIPNGDAWDRDGSGIKCIYLGHTGCEQGTARNQFGLDFDSAGRQWTKQLCEMDSDNDGVSNGQELGDPCCEWAPDNPIELRLQMLSHPGVPEQDGAREAPTCQRDADAPPAPAQTQPSPAPAQTQTSPAPAQTQTSPAPAQTQTSPAPAQTQTSPGASPSAQSSPTGEDDAAGDDPSDDDGDDDDDNDNVCFPAHAQVRLEDGSVRRMDQLQIGDRVHVGNGIYSPIFMFTHQHARIRYPFVIIQTDKQHSLTLTSGHFMYANDASVRASAVRVGDYVQLEDGSKSLVTAVSKHISNGLYNPQTLHGDLIVNGVRVTTYTSAIHLTLAHSLLTPLRAFYQTCATVGMCASLFEFVPLQVRSMLL